MLIEQLQPFLWVKKGGGVTSAWFEAYEIGFDQKTRNEYKQNLLILDKASENKTQCKSNILLKVLNNRPVKLIARNDQGQDGSHYTKTKGCLLGRA